MTLHVTPHAVILSTLETKAEEIAFLTECLSDHGVTSEVRDLSLDTQGSVLDGQRKLDEMARVIDAASEDLAERVAGRARVVVGLGGGTGGELVLGVMQRLPITFPKVLITTLPFDPRRNIADNSIILVPTLVDICGLNATLRQVIENAAAMIAGLCTSRRSDGACVEAPSVAVTALGATEAAVVPLLAAIRGMGQEATVFHSNGFGGAALTRFIDRGAFNAVVDLTPHELTRTLIAGAHVPMQRRFRAAAEARLPGIVLPGALNFIGLGEIELVPPAFLERPHYSHSGLFTHVQVTADEMVRVAAALADSLNAAETPAHLVVPMGGFSHQDGPGGAIEDPGLRGVFLDTVRARLRPEVPVTVLDAHISAPEVTELIAALLGDMLGARKEVQHA
ncbi:MAG: Tm-1-like ATP-binding domain-containing protein [Pseudomonadota bacterium]